LNQPDPFVWSAARGSPRRRGLRDHEDVAGATVPSRLIVSPAVALPLKNIWTL
jgi:hypothetical protein